jgi:acetyl esterase/lipase
MISSHVVHLLCAVGALAVSFQTVESAEPVVHKDIEFANVDGHSLKLDLYLPADGITWLTDHQFAVASISYRLTDKAIFPAQIHDCKASIRWPRANAGKYGYGVDRIGVSGSSAGGHLAALVGTSGGVKELEGTVGGNVDQSSRVDAVVDFYGATDFVLRSRTQPHRANQKGSVVYLLLGGGADEKVELAKQASAAFHVTQDDPPFLVFHGGNDKTVLLDQSERINEVYMKAGLPITLHVLKGSGHGGDEFYSGERRGLISEFLVRHLQ